MMRSRYGKLAVAVAVVAAIACTTLLAHAQEAVPPGMLVSSRDPAVIKGQLLLASRLGRQVLERFQTAPLDDALPLDASLVRSARDVYVLIRSARHGMELAKERAKYPDPLRDLAFKQVDSAWNLARSPVDMASSAGIPRQEYMRRSSADLGRALQHLDQALILLP